MGDFVEFLWLGTGFIWIQAILCSLAALKKVVKKEGMTFQSRNFSILQQLTLAWCVFKNNMRTVDAALERWSGKIVRNTWALNCSIKYHPSIQHSTSHFSFLYTASCLWPTARGKTLLMLYGHSKYFIIWSCMMVKFCVWGGRFLLWGLCCFVVLCQSGPEKMLVSNSNEYRKENKIPLQGRLYRDRAGELL